MNRYPSHEAISTAKAIFDSMPEALSERILRESMADVGAADINAYRARIDDLTWGRGDLSRRKAIQMQLLDKMNTWSIVLLSSRDIEANVSNIDLSETQKIKIYDTILAHRNVFFTEDRIKVNTTVITDNITRGIHGLHLPRREEEGGHEQNSQGHPGHVGCRGSQTGCQDAGAIPRK
ncbi:hypothetical protein QZH46_20550 [Pseudomonas corrugata]